MLPRRHRLRDAREFTRTVRSGRRASAGNLVGYLRAAPGEAPPRLGLIVSRQVGGSVQRHRVSRVVRHGARSLVQQLPAGSVLVLRALPGAAQRDAALVGDVERIVARLTTNPAERGEGR